MIVAYCVKTMIFKSTFPRLFRTYDRMPISCQKRTIESVSFRFDTSYNTRANTFDNIGLNGIIMRSSLRYQRNFKETCPPLHKPLDKGRVKAYHSQHIRLFVRFSSSRWNNSEL
jgi:hypothetical protein